MVVLAAAICTKTGKALLSRQFVEISRVRIEGLLASFPKLIGSDTQHTYIETENVRYVYHPLETLYLLLITSKGSNILEDLDTLHLIVKIIPEYCKSFEEEEIINNSFELIFAFDEVISLGYKEKASVQQIKTYTEMDSHDERIAEMQAKEKERDVRHISHQKQLQIEKDKDHMKSMGGGPMGGKYGGMGGGGSGSGSMGRGPPGGGMGGGQGPSSMSSASHSEPYVIKSSAQPERGTQTVKSSMSLGKAVKVNELMKQLEAEGEISQDEPRRAYGAQPSGPSAPAPSKIQSIHVKIDEKLLLITERDGVLKMMDVKGEFVVQISDPNYTKIKLRLNKDYNTNIQYRTHPNIDKKLFSNCIIGANDRPFPTNTPHVVLRWRYQPKDDSAVPLTVFCWPSTGSQGTTVVSMEYELLNQDLELRDVTVVIPIPGGHAPVVNSNDGEYKYDVKGYLNWILPIVNNDGRTGKMEFTIPYSGDTNALFPINVSFSSPSTFANIRVEDCVDQSNVTCPYSTDIRLSTEKFLIE